MSRAFPVIKSTFPAINSTLLVIKSTQQGIKSTLHGIKSRNGHFGTFQHQIFNTFERNRNIKERLLRAKETLKSAEITNKTSECGAKYIYIVCGGWNKLKWILWEGIEIVANLRIYIHRDS